MFFSIVIPVYNAEKYLSECVCSVLEQTFRDFEILLINDGSTDNSPNLCDEYANRYPDFIKVLHKDNEGQLFTRRRGFKMACGKYVISLDADDMLRKDALEILHQTIEQRNTDFVFFEIADNKEFKKEKPHFKYETNVLLNKKDIYDTIISRTCFNSLANKCIKRELIDLEKDYSGFSGVVYGEDLLQLLPVVDKAKAIVYINENLYYYRTNPNSMTHSFNRNRFYSASRVSAELCKYASKWHADQETVRRRNATVCASNTIYILCTKEKLRIKYSCIKEIAQSELFGDVCGSFDFLGLNYKQRIIIEFLYCIRILSGEKSEKRFSL